MRAWQKFRRSAPTADVVVGTTVETVVASLSGVSTQSADNLIRLDGFVAIAVGTGITGLELRVRRGTDATGAVVGEVATSTPAASTPVTATISVQDTPGDGVFAYVLTVVRLAGTGNGTVTESSLTSVN